MVEDGGGGRIRTFEVDDGRFTVCSLWPLGNPTRGNARIVDGGGRIIRRFAPHPSGRCLRQRCLAFARLEPLSKVLTLPAKLSLWALNEITTSLWLKMVVGEGFEPSKSMTADLQSAPFGRSGTPPRGNAFYWPASTAGSGAHHIK